MAMDIEPEFAPLTEIDKDSSDALVAVCSAVIVADGLITENEEDVVIDLLSKINLMGSTTSPFLFDAEYSETSDIRDQEDSYLPPESEEAIAIIKAVNNAWNAAEDNDEEQELLKLLADKISPNLATHAMAACIDAANADSKLQFEEGSVLAYFASVWGLEKELCAHFEKMFGGSWKLHSIGDVKTIVKRGSSERD